MGGGRKAAPSTANVGLPTRSVKYHHLHQLSVYDRGCTNSYDNATIIIVPGRHVVEAQIRGWPRITIPPFIRCKPAMAFIVCTRRSQKPTVEGWIVRCAHSQSH